MQRVIPFISLVIIAVLFAKVTDGQSLPIKLKKVVPFTINMEGKDEEFELYKVYEGKLNNNKKMDLLKRKHRYYEHYKMLFIIIDDKIAFKNELVLCPFYYFEYGNDGLENIDLKNNKLTTCEKVFDNTDAESMYLYHEFSLKKDSLILSNFYSSKLKGSEKVIKYEFEPINFTEFIHFMERR